jgi:ubiquitin carboxyl-terminal hydrolase 35/38
VVEHAVKSVVADNGISDVAVSAALGRMLDWLGWPRCCHLDDWVLCFLRELAHAKRFSILITVIQDKVLQVSTQFCQFIL